MRLWIVLICTVIALQSMVVRGETWTCSYNRVTGESGIIVRQRVEGGFADPTDPFAPVPMDLILYENDNVIHLYEEISDQFYATLFNKTYKTFVTVGLKETGSVSLLPMEGKCEVY